MTWDKEIFNSRTTIITLMWGSAFEDYGRRFLESFARYWPEETRLAVVCDAATGDKVRWLHPRRPHTFVLKLEGVPGFNECSSRWADDDRARGIGVKKGEVGRHWRHDALKWMPQALVPAAIAATMMGGDILCWLDADVVTHSPVPAGFIESLFASPEEQLIHLGRDDSSSEIGFWACRLDPMTRQMLDHFARLYKFDGIFHYAQQHSGFAFDIALDAFKQRGGVARSLTAGRGHVWFKTPLGLYMDHTKGKRKAGGYSPENPNKWWLRPPAPAKPDDAAEGPVGRG